MTADTMSVPVRPSRPDRSPTSAPDRVRSTAGPSRASRPLVDDHQGAPAWMRVVGGVVLAAGLALTAAVLGWPGDAPESALVIPGLVAVVVGVLALVARAGLTVTDDAVVLHFRPLPRRRIARRSITAVRVTEADARTYGGLGLRIGRRRRALVLTPGPGVEITDASGRTTFVRSDRPQDAVRALVGAAVDSTADSTVDGAATGPGGRPGGPAGASTGE
ncbi:hypothetical protein [Curtobacterium sp. MCBD17_030]|uniref:hypothetical protein n=1 Tax=Curtobacterium sp. MCBD17_030 TaxID=2175649 RepID=UPI000D824BFD|nr:hypothetical protein [Curtobacterium sp. MCBD17_030]PYY34375.1 hypothetical protein DEI89_08910 [Curtobacterium sp. MCBD17_030]